MEQPNAKPGNEGGDERRQRLRRLDDLLEALETLNLNEASVLPTPVFERLVELGIAKPEKKSLAGLIDDVLQAQEQYMVKIEIPRPERRLRQRRPLSRIPNAWMRRTI